MGFVNMLIWCVFLRMAARKGEPAPFYSSGRGGRGPNEVLPQENRDKPFGRWGQTFDSPGRTDFGIIFKLTDV